MKNPLGTGHTGRARAHSKQGQAGYDNPRENIDPHVKTQVVSSKEIIAADTISGGYLYGDATYLRNLPAGSETDPLWNTQSGAYLMIADYNTVSGSHLHTAYADEADFQTVSGAVILNTAKVSYTDAVQFQVVSGATLANTASGASILTSHQSLSGAYYTHAADSSDPHGATLTQTNITSSGIFSGARMSLTEDKSGALSGAATIINTIFGTSATPPTASDYPIGTVYYQYTP